MPDIASNILYTLVTRELARQGIGAPGRPVPVPVQGTVPLHDKSSLLSAVQARHGLLPILRIGQGIREAGPEPTLQALLQARDPEDLLTRWQRLERYVHSRHRIVTRGQAPGELLVEHVSVRQGEAPSAAEDCLILGLLAALFQAIGAENLTAHLVGPDGELPVLDAGGPIDPGPAPHATSLWRFRWHGVAAGRTGSAGRASPLPFAVDDAARPLVARLVDLVLADCARSWTVAAAARQLGQSTRSLQRRLAEAGTGFAAVVRTAQVRHATDLLLAGELSVAEVGLLCGFSDQAHFSREFKRRTNIPPGRYRAEFAAAPGRQPHCS